MDGLLESETLGEKLGENELLGLTLGLVERLMLGDTLLDIERLMLGLYDGDTLLLRLGDWLRDWL